MGLLELPGLGFMPMAEKRLGRGTRLLAGVDLTPEEREQQRQEFELAEWDRRWKAQWRAERLAADEAARREFEQGAGTTAQRALRVVRILGYSKPKSNYPPADLLLFAYTRELSLKVLKERYRAPSEDAVLKALWSAKAKLQRERSASPVAAWTLDQLPALPHRRPRVPGRRRRSK